MRGWDSLRYHLRATRTRGGGSGFQGVDYETGGGAGGD